LRRSTVAQAARGFGRNLYVSGKDYNALYGQVTGLVDGMKVGELDKKGVGMGQLADAIESLPDNFSRAVFDLVVDGKGPSRDNGSSAAMQQCSRAIRYSPTGARCCSVSSHRLARLPRPAPAPRYGHPSTAESPKRR
jgi:hypothetical protein